MSGSSMFAYTSHQSKSSQSQGNVNITVSINEYLPLEDNDSAATLLTSTEKKNP